MALDEDGMKAVELLVRSYREALQAPLKNRKMLESILDDKCGDLARSDYAEVIEVAARRVFTPGAAAKVTGGSEIRSGGGAPSGGAKRKITPRPPIDETLIEAPYRFIDIAREVVAPPVADIPLDQAQDGLYSGTIRVEWIAETPLLIGAPVSRNSEGQPEPPVEPIRLGARGPHVIPGATLRGLVRAACEIVGYAKLPRGNWHHRYGLRDFDHPYYTRADGISDISKVGAGFLSIRDAVESDPASVVVVDGSKRTVWELSPASWEHVPIETLTPANGIDTPPRPWKENTLLDKYRSARMMKGTPSPDFGKTFQFVRKAVHRKDNREMVPDASGSVAGVFCFSGKLRGGGNKKFEYAFFRKPGAKRAIPADIVSDFLRLHTTPNKNKMVPAFSWKDLHRSALQPPGVPVFTVGDLAGNGGDFFFGLTRLFKVPHRLSVEGVVRGSLPAHVPKGRLDAAGRDGRRHLGSYTPDFVENLFGYVAEPKDLDLFDAGALIDKDGGDISIDPSAVARRSRIAFGFARLSPHTPARVETDAVKLIQMAPRASFAPFYLKGDQEKDYSGGSPALAGRKTYLPRYSAPTPSAALKAMRIAGKAQIDAVNAQSTTPNDASGVTSHLKFLMPTGPKPLCFTGEIRLHNLRAEEIGLLLFAITHGGDRDRVFRHMVGRARPFGAGQMRIGRVVLDVEANVGDPHRNVRPAEASELFDAATGRGFAVAGSCSHVPFLDAFIDFMKDHVPGFPATAPLREWFGAASPAEAERIEAEGSKLAYRLTVDDFARIRKFVKPMDPSAGKPLQDRPRLLPAPEMEPPMR